MKRVVQFESRCRELGIPLTIQRRTIFQALVKRKDHPTVDDIFEAIKKKVHGVSRATIYRVLETFVRLGLVRRIYSAESAVRFDPNLECHHHLVCSRCRAVFDFEDAKLDRLPMPNVGKTGFQAQAYSVYFEGVCKSCLKAEEKGSREQKNSIQKMKTKRGDKSYV